MKVLANQSVRRRDRRSAIAIGSIAISTGLTASHAFALPPLDEIVMYEANIRAMSVAGDFAGVTARLDEIEALGVNTIWLMPFHPTGQINRFGSLGSPYSVRDYLAVATEYGTLNDLHALIAAAHARDITVLMDWPANHTAWDHPWVTQHPEWYTTNAQGQIVHPAGTNWLDVADLNHDAPEMRAAMIDQMTWWVTNTQIDGFRMDAADFVPRAFWEEAIPAVRAGTPRPLLMLAEGARDDHHDAGFDLTFGWRFYEGLRRVFVDGWNADEIQNAHADESAALPMGKRVLRWTTNHDETAFNAPPPVLFGGVDPSLAAFASMVMHGATPLIYSGQEVGSTDNTSFVEHDPIDWTDANNLADWHAWMIDVRQQHASIRRGAITCRSSTDALIVARTLGEERVAAWINTRDHQVTAPVPTAWLSTWTDLGTNQSQLLAAPLLLQPHEIRVVRLDAWPSLVISGALQTEQGDPTDWDPTQSSLVLDRTSSVYVVQAHNLVDGQAYDFEIVTDRAQPPIDSADPRVSTGLRAFGDANGTITITVDDTQTNNKGETVVWIDTDAAPLQVVGNFMDEAGGGADWNPADPSFAMTSLGQGRYAYETSISTPGTYVFKTSFGNGWAHQVGVDGFNDNAAVLEFETTTPDQQVRLIVDLRARRLEARVGPFDGGFQHHVPIDLFDLLDYLHADDNNDPAADFDRNGVVDHRDMAAALEAFTTGRTNVHATSSARDGVQGQPIDHSLR